MISFGGISNLHAPIWSNVASSSTQRKIFAKSVKQFIIDLKLDGVGKKIF